MTTVLFTTKNSIYKKLGCDVYDQERNALTWSGGEPALYHPPCRLFCKLKHLAKAPINEKELAYWSVDMVQKYGGVLEHPAYSNLWAEKNLPLPGQSDEFGFSIDINQSWFGHKTHKRTWLYIVGITAKELPDYQCWETNITHQFRFNKRNRKSNLKELSKKQALATPPEFAKWLIEIVERIKSNNPSCLHLQPTECEKHKGCFDCPHYK